MYVGIYCNLTDAHFLKAPHHLTAPLFTMSLTLAAMPSAKPSKVAGSADAAPKGEKPAKGGKPAKDGERPAKPSAEETAKKFGGLPRPADLAKGKPGPDGKILETNGDVKRARSWLMEATAAHKKGLPIPPYAGAETAPESTEAAAPAPAAAVPDVSLTVPTGSPVAAGDEAVPAASSVPVAAAPTTAILGLPLLAEDKQVALFAHLPQPDRPEGASSAAAFGIPHEGIPAPFQALGLAWHSGTCVGSTARLAGFVTALRDFTQSYELPETEIVSSGHVDAVGEDEVSSPLPSASAPSTLVATAAATAATAAAAAATGSSSTFVPSAPAVSFSASLVKALRPVLRFLRECRPLTLPLATFLRTFRSFISRPSVATLPEKDARDRIVEWLDDFFTSHIVDVMRDTAKNIANLIREGDTVLTFALSNVVARALELRAAEGVAFNIIVVDARPRLEGRELTRRLAAKGIESEYALVTGLPHIIPRATKVILGAHAVLSNGNALSRAGTSLVAAHARAHSIPVLVGCPSFKFSEEVQLDALTSNEIGAPDDLTGETVDSTEANSEAGAAARAAVDPFSPAAALLPLSAPEPVAAATDADAAGKRAGGKGARTGRVGDKDSVGSAVTVSEWRKLSALKLLSLNYDVTPAECITALVTESKIPVPTTSAPAILREFFKDVERSNP